MNLLSSIGQNIASMWDRLRPEATYEELRDYVVDSLDKMQDQTAKLRFINRKCEPEETFEAYAANLTYLAYGAYGNRDTPWQSDQITERVLEIYLQNLQGVLGQKVREMFPNSIEHAISLSRNFQVAGYSEQEATTTISYVPSRQLHLNIPHPLFSQTSSTARAHGTRLFRLS